MPILLKTKQGQPLVKFEFSARILLDFDATDDPVTRRGPRAVVSIIRNPETLTGRVHITTDAKEDHNSSKWINYLTRTQSPGE